MIRKSVLSIVLVAFSMALFITCSSNPKGVNSQNFQAIFRENNEAVVLIETEIGKGTGFFINSSGTVLTCYHVVEGARQIRISYSGRTYNATIERFWAAEDQAILRTDITRNRYVRVNPPNRRNMDLPGVLDSVMAMGFPTGPNLSINQGYISSIFPPTNSGMITLQTDTAINPGNSGGPIFNERGIVIGIATSIISPDEGSGIGFIHTIDWLVSLMPYHFEGHNVTTQPTTPAQHAISRATITLTPGRPYNATLQGTAEQRYNIRVPAGRRLIAYTESNLDTVMRIYNAQGEEIAFDDDSGTNLNARVNIRVPAGTYTIEVRGYGSGDTGPYTLHTITEAVVITNLTAGRVHRATLQGTIEQLYNVRVPAGRRLIAYTESNLDTVMRIYNAQGEEIASDDDSGTGLNARVNIRVPAGTYTIEVRGYDSGDTGPYTLHTLTEPVVITNISAGRVHSAELQGTIEQLYNIRVPAGRLIAYTESSVDTVMHIYNSRGQEIASDDDSGTNLNARVDIVVPAGTYTIEVRGFSSRDVGSYTLHTLTQ